MPERVSVLAHHLNFGDCEISSEEHQAHHCCSWSFFLLFLFVLSPFVLFGCAGELNPSWLERLGWIASPLTCYSDLLLQPETECPLSFWYASQTMHRLSITVRSCREPELPPSVELA